MRRTYNSYIGKKQHFLKILGYEKIGKGYFTCLCDCGNTKRIRCDHVLNGRTVSCGCQANKECYKDLTGMKFERLTVLSKAYKKGYVVYWNCKCDCGTETIVSSHNLTSKSVKSCGCYMVERTKEVNTKHGGRNTKLYGIYIGMKSRCYNKKEAAYSNYGSRGIKVCDKWLSKNNGFIAFRDWALANGYEEGLSIDRVNVNGNYEPGNCRWVNDYVQANNRRTNRYFIHNGVMKTMKEWSQELGISYSAVQYRLRKHKPLNEVFGIDMKEAL